MESGKFRKKRKSFAQVSNYALMDKNLSLKAKGLYAMIESYISIPDFTLYKDFLIKNNSDGERSFDSAWKELKETGYLKVFKMQANKQSPQDNKGTQQVKGFYYEYLLLDEPETDEKIKPTKCTPEKCTPEFCNSEKSKSENYGSIINNQEKNIELNNTYINNNSKKLKASKEDVINDFYYKTSDVDFKKINNHSSKQERLDKFLRTLNDNELQIIQSFDKANAMSFYIAAMDLFDDPKIQNKEGYLRTVLKSPESFISSFTNKTIHKEHNEIYDSSKNVKITPEEEEAFYRMRYSQNEDLKLL